MKILYIAASGRADPVRAGLPFHLAVNGSVPQGHEVEIVLAGDATDLVVGDTVDTLEPLGLPPLRELVAAARENQVPVHL